jgi:hypothetical protein
VSVVNRYDVSGVKCSLSKRTVYMHTPTGNLEFKFSFLCERHSLHSANSFRFFFNVENFECLVVTPTIQTSYALKFWIANDLPVLSSNLFILQNAMMQDIGDDFKDKYASYLLDNIINSE